jgi:hypothetical protein
MGGDEYYLFTRDVDLNSSKIFEHNKCEINRSAYLKKKGKKKKKRRIGL